MSADFSEAATAASEALPVLSRSGQSGLSLLDENVEAFAARGVLARSAEKTLDLLYYDWRFDMTGKLLLREALCAADRGVRVRLLMDDFSTGGRDRGARSLASHPNIEVRYFNPTRARDNVWRRRLEILLNFWTSTRRMHNKAWIADGRAAIVGGRNIGDPYFDACREMHFSDLDVFVVGDAATQAQQTFDVYWSSKASKPRRARESSVRRLVKLRRKLEEVAQIQESRLYIDAIEKAVQARTFFDDARRHWTANARIIADPPEKAAGRKEKEWIADAIHAHIDTARQRLTLVSPYFVPGQDGVSHLCALSKRGVEVTVLTNSLASTDVAAVHGGYAKYRAPLLDGGVRLFELRAAGRRSRLSAFGSSSASLHTKAYVFDGQEGFVGSYNFDPRSRSINTEMGVIFDCPELVREIETVFARELSYDNSYPLKINSGRLNWGESLDRWLSREPAAGLRRRLIAALASLSPFEAQL